MTVISLVRWASEAVNKSWVGAVALLCPHEKNESFDIRRSQTTLHLNRGYMW